MNEFKKPFSILAIDDDPADLKLLKISIGGIPGWKGFKFYSFNSWEAANPELDNRHIDIIFVDYLLGRNTGLDVVKAIRNKGDLRPIIVLTGHGDEAIAAEVTRAGADDYLVKQNLDAETIRRAVSNALTQFNLRSEKQLLGAQLLQSQKMETIGSLTGGIAHDFNNMLTAVIGGIELAGMISTEEEVQNELNQAQKVCNQMAGLVKQLLNFSRKDNVMAESISVDETIGQLQAILTHTLPKNIKIFMPPLDKYATVMANSTLIQQILLNLCINGSEAMPHGGQLTLKTQPYYYKPGQTVNEETALPEGDYIQFKISDTGFGMDSKTVTRIFEPFFTTKQLGTKKGTGLGLAIVWQNIKNMGGSIIVDSTPGKGTTFNVMLPAGKPEGVKINPPVSNEKIDCENEGSILIVDDETAVLALAEKMVKRLGYKTYSADSGKTALEVFSKIKDELDLIIMDISMPEMDGKTCLKEILQLKPSQKVYFASGHDMTLEKEKILSLGAMGIIQKPYSFKQLADMVKSALDEQSN
jgi:two-component system cell cycle sensor histidine kinase/response regulator CckA